MEISPLQKERYKYCPKLPSILYEPIEQIKVQEGNITTASQDNEEIEKLFPNIYGQKEITFIKGQNSLTNKKLKIGVILSGGQAPGGHNVISGLFDALKAANSENTLIGFLGGPSGLVDNKWILLEKEYIDKYRNTGGFDIIGSGRTKLETEEQFEKAQKVCKELGINALVIIGGDDSNTNAAILAEYFKSKNYPIQVIGCPKTIDGDLKNEDIETSFGFDTATKTYSELIGNIERDANSSKKYWHFIKVMGRSASHIALECALETHPNICLISEEIEEKKLSLSAVADLIVSSVVKRGNRGENFGVVVIPEGVIEFIPEVKVLISEINDILALKNDEFNTLETLEDKNDFMKKYLTKESFSVYSILDDSIKAQLMMDRDPHGNVQVSRIESEKLLSSLVEAKLKVEAKNGNYKGKFSPFHHFFGYEGRCAFPSNFDSDYCYSLGYNAFLLILNGYTGYLSRIKNLAKPSSAWEAGGMPITKMMNIEHRHGKNKPVIKKALVDLNGKPFLFFKERRDTWSDATSFVYPGSIQYFGPKEVADKPTITLELENS